MESAIQTFKDNSIELKPHQLDAMKWLVNVETNCDPAGGILADDMGLGKTLEALSVILANRLPHTLIIVPASLVDQWILEINKFASDLDINVDYPGGDVTITSFHKAAKRASLRDFVWDRIILDEGHYIRNHKTQTHKQLKEIDADHKWILSGTPIQNSLKDLKTLMRFIGAEWCDDDEFESLVEEHVLRRTKEELDISMPPLKVFKHYIDFSSDNEKKLYEKVDLGLKYNNSSCQLVKFLRLRQYTLLPQMVLDSVHDKEKDSSDDYIYKYSNTKLDGVINTLKKYRNDEKPIVFCHFKKEMEYLKQNLTHDGFRVDVINGDVSMDKRREIIDNHEKIDILLIQLQAGSVGLNLQMFNGVYFTAPHWNPTHERQAVCRAYRLGQTKTVYVRRFAIRNTIEQLIINKQKLKKDIARQYNLL